MNLVKTAILLSCAALFLLLPGCATSPEDAARRAEAEADIDEIMSYELDPDEYGEAKDCLGSHEYDNFRPLGDRHILFEDRRGKLWVNTLRARCRALQHGDVLVVKQSTGRRMCDTDRFEATDLFDYPAGGISSNWGTGGSCLLGDFHPVTEAQVAEIEAVLESLER
ncbi:MAG: DUF6491 family protein [Woeseiaceae bacterium]